MTERLALDHVIYGTGDLDAAASRFEARLGLASVAGGRHPGHGTANRILPLGDAYVEIMGVVDPDEAEHSPLGRRLLDHLAGGDRPFRWCIRTEDIDATQARLDLVVVPWNRTRPDGVELAWRLAGFEVAMEEPALPFFIQWDVDDSLWPGRAEITHPSGASRLAWVEVAGSASRMREWLAAADVPVRIVDGEPGVVAAGIGAPAGEIVVA